MKYLMFLSLFLSVGCGRYTKFHADDVKAQEYLALTMDYYRKLIPVGEQVIEYGVDIDSVGIRMKNRPSTVAGTCFVGRQEIWLDPKLFDLMSNQRRVWVVLHEMGHAILGLRHSSAPILRGDCKIMQPFVDFCTRSNFEEAVRQFNKKLLKQVR